MAARHASSSACRTASRAAGSLRLLELEHDAGENLADLVVQLARDALALVLLRRQRAPPALAPLVLEPRQYVVERGRERLDLGVGVRDHQAPPGLERLDRAHRGGQPPERSDDATQQHEVHRHRDDEAGDDDHGLGVGHGEADLDGREQQQQRDHREHRRVREDDAREQ
jgi:hypothetical protein